mmetsp:Transcript_21839/g.33192  ORF Transcript_21839/g.33192 Transcript_21839/m.33192 type:complete len:374 (-) Transcript_21839:187-1308(-)
MSTDTGNVMTIILLTILISSINSFVASPLIKSLYRQHTIPLIFGLTNSDDEVAIDKPTIAIIGSGAVGCYYGARLWETNEYQIKFHMRGDHYTTSIEKGLMVTSVEGDIFIPPDELLAYNRTEDIGKSDWVIVALKSTGIGSIPELLEPLLKESSRVLAIMNGLVDEDIIRLIEGQGDDEEPFLTKCAATYGGMALLCSNKKGPGHVDHSYAGKLTASLSKSSSIADIGAHERAMIDLWKPTRGFEFVYDPCLTRARWSKNLWNLPFNGISVAMNVTVDKIVQDEGLRRLSYKIMDETLAVANEDINQRGFSDTGYLGEVEKEQMMALSDAMGPYKTSTMLDFRNERKMEVKVSQGKASTMMGYVKDILCVKS